MRAVLHLNDRDADFILTHSYYYYYLEGNEYGIAVLQAAADVQSKLPYGYNG